MSEPQPEKMEEDLQTLEQESGTANASESNKRKSEEVEMESKRKAVELESRKRSKRMFGLLQGTLNEARKQTQGSSKQRELESRLSLKLSEEKKELESKRANKLQQIDSNKKEDELRSVETIFTTRNQAKLNLANFLCTTFVPPAVVNTDELLLVAVASNLPSAIQVKDGIKPIYYLPYRLLRSQEELINSQIEQTKLKIQVEVDAFNKLKQERLKTQEIIHVAPTPAVTPSVIPLQQDEPMNSEESLAEKVIEMEGEEAIEY